MNEKVPQVGEEIILEEDRWDDEGDLMDNPSIDEVNGQLPDHPDAWLVSADGEDYTIKWNEEYGSWEEYEEPTST
jgi:hypothetical protein